MVCCGCCPCFGKNKNKDDDMYEDPERDRENGDYSDNYSDYSEINALLSSVDEDDLPPAVDDIPLDEEEEVPQVVIVTEASFQKPEKKKRVLKTLFKKMKKPMSHVRFASNTHAEEKSNLIETPQGSHDSGYGTTLMPIQRSDSLESFMSALSSATTAGEVEEFGDEVSPSRVQLTIQYDQRRWTLLFGVKQADCLITTNKGTMYWQVHMTLMPFKKHRFKTRYKASSTPIFNQTFEVENIPAQALAQLSVRYRIYGRAGRTGRKKMAGETEIDLSQIMDLPDKTIKEWRVLRRSTDRRSEENANMG